jgi:hypothetical protein
VICPVVDLSVKKLPFAPKNLSIPTSEAVKALAPSKLKFLLTLRGDIITSWEFNVLKTAIHLRNLTLL